MKTYIVTVQNNSPESTVLNKEIKNEVFSETSLRELKFKFRITTLKELRFSKLP